MEGIRRKLVLLAVLLAVVPGATASAAPSLYIDPFFVEVWEDEYVWVDVAINDELLGLTGYDLLLDYDESVVELIDVVEGALPQTAGATFFYWTTDPGTSNAIVINGAVLGDSVDGPGVIARIHFRAIALGTTPVEFLSFELRDIDNVPLFAVPNDGYILVNEEPTIYLTPTLTQVFEGTTFTVDVAINNTLTDLTGYNLTIALDPTIVTYVGVEEGPLPSSTGHDTYFFWTDEPPPHDTLVINGAVLGGWVNGPGVLATITLFAAQPGTTDMVFTDVDLRDIENGSLSAASKDALIIVDPGGSPTETTSWSAVKALFR